MDDAQFVSVVATVKYSTQWQSYTTKIDTWLPTSMAGILAIMAFTAIIGYIVKK